MISNLIVSFLNILKSVMVDVYVLPCWYEEDRLALFVSRGVDLILTEEESRAHHGVM